MMTNISPPEKSRLDLPKWFLVGIVLASAVALNHYYELGIVLRAALILASAFVAVLIACSTTKGAQFVVFVRESKTEVRKVVWPTRQEVMQTTLVVLVATLLVGLLLWGLDALLLRLVSFLTGVGV